MLVLSREIDSTIMVGDDVEFGPIEVRGNKVRIRIFAPKDLPVHRLEVYQALLKEKKVDRLTEPDWFVSERRATTRGSGFVLERERDESIMFGDDVEVAVVYCREDKVRFHISAPKSVAVHRKEVYEALKEEKWEKASYNLERGKGRVYFVAKELGVKSSDIVKKCQEKGYNIKNHMSKISGFTAARIREWYAGSKEGARKKKPTQQFSQKHYEMLRRCSEKKNMGEWNSWRRAHSSEKVLLGGTDLRGAFLEGADLRVTSFVGANLSESRLKGAILNNTTLRGADLTGADLRSAEVGDVCFLGAILDGAKFDTVELLHELQKASRGGAEEETCEGSALHFEIGVPDVASDDEVESVVLGLIEHADALHRAMGGHGLKIESLEMFGDVPARELVRE